MKFVFILIVSILLSSCASKVMVKDCEQIDDSEFYLCESM